MLKTYEQIAKKIFKKGTRKCLFFSTSSDVFVRKGFT